jgi:pimeloyl-ACP methyl ester carboxylesterase
LTLVQFGPEAPADGADATTLRLVGEQLTIDTGDVSLGAVRWPGRAGAPTVVAVHGITANAWSWGVVARHLDSDVELLAVDLRGRGSSAGAPPPFGMRQHADDVAAIIGRLGIGPSVLLAHSMGTYVALLCAERHPAAVSDLVLVDGGVALVVPDDVDADTLLDATLGPAIARLRQVWPDTESYRAMWEQHPAFAGRITGEVEKYVMSDLVETDGGFRSSVSEAAVRHDGRELLTDPEVRSALERHGEPIRIVRAELGLFATPPPLVPVEFEERFPQHDWTTVAGSNHYDVLIGDEGASVVAEAVRAAVTDRA